MSYLTIHFLKLRLKRFTKYHVPCVRLNAFRVINSDFAKPGCRDIDVALQVSVRFELAVWS
jgi:hypothetical protein